MAGAGLGAGVGSGSGGGAGSAATGASVAFGSVASVLGVNVVAGFATATSPIAFFLGWPR